MTNFDDGTDTTRVSDMLRQDPIPADCFLPPRLSCPRAWHRVPVAPVAGLRRQPKIWKRVGGLGLETAQSPYVRAMTELEKQGTGPRKRARHAHHMQAWGDARWDSRAEEERDGQQDIVEAQRLVSAAKQETASATSSPMTRPATFPEETLKWIPRKRHNTRWPVEPKNESGRIVAYPQQSTELEKHDSVEPVEATAKMDEKQMQRRSTRRLSRRISLIAGNQSPRKLLAITLSPAGRAVTAASPVKRTTVSLSPTKVADSPHRSFKVTATPTKVVLESPKISPPEKSPEKLASSPSKPSEDAPQTPGTATGSASISSVASPAPLMFDQPALGVQAEPQHEARRRLSLQSARRSERSSSGALRLLALKRGQDSPNRRHSLTAFEDGRDGMRAKLKTRRKTMDALCVGLGSMRKETEDTRKVNATSAQNKPDEVVEIDMKTSLDIFGQSTMTAEPISPLRNDEGQQTSEAPPVSGLQSTSVSSVDVVLPANYSHAHPDVTLSSSTSNTLGETDEAEVNAGAEDATTRSQRATGLVTDRVHDDHCFKKAYVPYQADFTGAQGENEVIPAPQDTELLSTIHEEESSLDKSTSISELQHAPQRPAPDSDSQICDDEESPSEQELIEAQFINGEMLVTNAGQCGLAPTTMLSSSPPASHQLNRNPLVFETAATGAVQDERSMVAGSLSGFYGAPSSVASAADGMAASDLPHHGGERAAIGGLQQSAVSSEVEILKSPRDGQVEPCSTSSGTTELSSSSSQSEHPTSSPPKSSQIERGAGLMEDVTTPKANDTFHERSSFTPINRRQTSPSGIPPNGLRDDEDTTRDHETDELDADEVVEEDIQAEEVEEEVVPMEEDMTVGAPKPECDTLQLHARQDDSETEMLRNFVTRVAADKNAKAAAAAAALAKKIARRSSSIGSITSSTGSPIGRPGSESPASRKPLGIRSPNSASPAKKRKADFLEDDLTKDISSHDSPTQPTDGRRLKKRRKRADPVLSSPLRTATPSPEPKTIPSSMTGMSASSHSGPRRSTRARSTRVALKPTAPSANSIAFSMIPVRLPGMGAMDDTAPTTSETQFSAARQRSAEKDLAAVTRANTRKNKGGAVPPPVVLAKQAEDPAAWRMRELKVVWEAKERRKGETACEEEGLEEEQGGRKKGKKGGKAKGVRWAEELVRFQPYEEGGGVFGGLARALLADVMADDGVDEIAEAEPPMPAGPVVEKTARVAARKTASSSSSSSESSSSAPAVAAAAPPAVPVSTRRTRSSRLPPPTPVKKLRSATKPAAVEKNTGTEESAAAEKPAAVPNLRTRARSLPKRTAAPAPAPTAVDPSATATSSSTKTGMATRRTRVTKLGMSGNGTPAPKRRARVAA
ncbi:hypothetical protein C7999DRAFT_35668 [Corynascus novoguineensis]|uniref:Uncharacterized protein n=1 Tax=Corynascus novoguineensis TaxID=1126955 RepID=A0AAN7HBS1_9PEZI|nr:hypothetical protein C7999DRAFT_35668 [Corynascus novoguineensis]